MVPEIIFLKNKAAATADNTVNACSIRTYFLKNDLKHKKAARNKANTTATILTSTACVFISAHTNNICVILIVPVSVSIDNKTACL